MKVAIVLLGLCTTLTAWWWLSSRARSHGPLTLGKKLRIGAHSLVIGIGVYFGLLLVALAYLMLTDG